MISSEYQKNDGTEIDGLNLLDFTSQAGTALNQNTEPELVLQERP